MAIKEQTNGDYAYRDDSGVGYVAIDEDTQWKDQYGNTYSVLNDETHRFGIVMEQHTITSSDGTTVTVTEKQMANITTVMTMELVIPTMAMEPGPTKMEILIRSN